ncbi:hypothetical protein MHBO_000670 [Bonamia ostreae]|uniref:Superoxide dismutase n=1 Tax=Bonamia ostreae TaxID=126728 RepID=A0ABV2AGZ7_9EUKA
MFTSNVMMINKNKQKNIWFNGGGHVNHSIFWKNLCPVPEGGGNIDYAPNVMAEIKKKYKSFEIFKKEFNAITVGIHGSGWGWLIYSRKNKELEIKTTQNQEMVAFKHKGSLPLLGVDVWEHAYYLKYENRRNEYLENIWKVVNWKDVERRFMSRFNLSESD